MKVLVTGANGYIGKHVVEALLNKGCDVYAADVRFEGMDERVNKVTAPIFDNPNIFEESGCRMCVFTWHGEMGSCTIQRHILSICLSIMRS